MVINQINVTRMTILKAEDDAPVAGHGDGPETGQIAF